MAVGGTSWHPPAEVLELAELVLDGALPGLPELSPLLAAGVSEFAEGLALAVAGGELGLEDAEGTPVAVLAPDGRLRAVRPFTHPPLRSRRRTPEQAGAELAALGAGPVTTVPITAVPHRDVISQVIAAAGPGPT